MGRQLNYMAWKGKFIVWISFYFNSTLILYYWLIVNSRYFKVHTEGPSDFFFDRAEQGGDGVEAGAEDEDLFADLPAQVSEIIGRPREQIDADDEAVLMEHLTIDDDNDPLPDNMLRPDEYLDYIFKDWCAPSICFRRSQNINNSQASVRMM